jgi:hypothetical protein
VHAGAKRDRGQALRTLRLRRGGEQDKAESEKFDARHGDLKNRTE